MLMLQLWAVVRCQGTSGHCSSLIWFCLSLDSSACVPRVPAISHLRCSQQGKRDSPQEKGRNCPATLLKEGWETVLKIIRVRQPTAAYRGIVLKGLGILRTRWKKWTNVASKKCLSARGSPRHKQYFVWAVLSVLNNLQRTSANCMLPFA